jgi:hypothetical protein
LVALVGESKVLNDLAFEKGRTWEFWAQLSALEGVLLSFSGLIDGFDLAAELRWPAVWARFAKVLGYCFAVFFQGISTLPLPIKLFPVNTKSESGFNFISYLLYSV